MTGKLLFGCLLFQLCDLFPWIKEIMQEGFIFSQLIQTANDINLEFYLILHSIHTISNTTPLPASIKQLLKKLKMSFDMRSWSIWKSNLFL